jgi:hypothetical protein
MIATTGATLGARLLAATNAVRDEGPLAGYRVLAGPGRVSHLGPAFGTKFLFFQSRRGDRALIFDRLMSSWLREHCDPSLNPTTLPSILTTPQMHIRFAPSGR